ncbi:MAG TPA: hypothetical protein PLZ49_00085 [Bacillota bacterium]|nr:hypothetical protein [Bacillota bacterium]
MVYRLKNLAEMAAAAGLEMAGIAPADPPAYLQSLLQRRLDEGRGTLHICFRDAAALSLWQCPFPFEKKRRLP